MKKVKTLLMFLLLLCSNFSDAQKIGFVDIQ